MNKGVNDIQLTSLYTWDNAVMKIEKLKIIELQDAIEEVWFKMWRCTNRSVCQYGSADLEWWPFTWVTQIIPFVMIMQFMGESCDFIYFPNKWALSHLLCDLGLPCELALPMRQYD